MKSDRVGAETPTSLSLLAMLWPKLELKISQWNVSEGITDDETKRIRSKSFLSHFYGCEQLKFREATTKSSGKRAPVCSQFFQNGDDEELL